MNLWEEYKNALHDTISLHNGVGSVWANWKSKGTNLTAKTYTNKYLIKSRDFPFKTSKLNISGFSKYTECPQPGT